MRQVTWIIQTYQWSMSWYETVMQHKMPVVVRRCEKLLTDHHKTFNAHSDVAPAVTC